MTTWTQAGVPEQEFPTTPAASTAVPVYQPREQVIRTPKVAYRGQPGTSTAVLYTAPILTSSPTGASPCTALVKCINVCNTSTSALTYTITVVESGGSVATNRAIFKDVAIAAKTSHIFMYADDEFALADGETINGTATQAFSGAEVTLRITVVELTH